MSMLLKDSADKPEAEASRINRSGFRTSERRTIIYQKYQTEDQSRRSHRHLVDILGGHSFHFCLESFHLMLNAIGNINIAVIFIFQVDPSSDIPRENIKQLMILLISCSSKTRLQIPEPDLVFIFCQSGTILGTNLALTLYTGAIFCQHSTVHCYCSNHPVLVSFRTLVKDVSNSKTRSRFRHTDT